MLAVIDRLQVYLDLSKALMQLMGPPGPPPREGLEWKEETHRWIRPETGEHHESTAADFKEGDTVQWKAKGGKIMEGKVLGFAPKSGKVIIQRGEGKPWAFDPSPFSKVDNSEGGLSTQDEKPASETASEPESVGKDFNIGDVVYFISLDGVSVQGEIVGVNAKTRMANIDIGYKKPIKVDLDRLSYDSKPKPKSIIEGKATKGNNYPSILDSVENANALAESAAITMRTPMWRERELRVLASEVGLHVGLDRMTSATKAAWGQAVKPGVLGRDPKQMDDWSAQYYQGKAMDNLESTFYNQLLDNILPRFSPLEQNLPLYRGMRYRAAEAFLNAEVGSTVELDRLTSTSVGHEVPWVFSEGEVFLEIRNTQNVPTLTENAAQAEVVLPPGVKLQIKDKRELPDNDFAKHHVIVEVVPD